MINQIPPELFAQRPVRSQYQSLKGTSAVTKRRVILIGGIAVILLGAIYAADTLISKEEINVAMIPHIAATGDIKERPEQPGGIDIPHRDVTVFGQLDERVDAEEDPKVEHLLPQAEEPVVEMQADGDSVGTSMEKAVTESLDKELNRAAESMTPEEPAVTAAVLDPQTEELLNAQPAETLPAVEPQEEAKTEAKTVVTTKVVEPVQAQVKMAVQEAEKTMKVDAPKVVKKKKVITPKITKEPKGQARLPAELFTKGEKAVKQASEKMMRTQLGSFRSEDMARKASQVIKKKYSGVLKGKDIKVVRADLGAKGIYYRVMSIAMPKSQARKVCAAVKAENSACILVR